MSADKVTIKIPRPLYEKIKSAIEGSATFPEIEPIFTIDPPDNMRGINARQTLKTPLQFTPITASQSASELSVTVFST